MKVVSAFRMVVDRDSLKLTKFFEVIPLPPCESVHFRLDFV